MTFNFINGAQVKFALAWCLQFGEPVYDVYGIINLVFAVVVLVVVVVVSVVSISFSTWNWNTVINEAFLSKKRLETLSIRQKKFACLHHPYVVEFSLGRYFYLVQAIKNTLFVVIIYVYQGHAIEQSYLLLFLSIVYTVILVVGQPFKRKIDLAIVLLNEICLLIEEILLVIFSINQKTVLLEEEIMNIIGWVMIGCMVAVLGINGIFIILSIAIPIFEYFRRKKVNMKNKVQAKTLAKAKKRSTYQKTRIREIWLED